MMIFHIKKYKYLKSLSINVGIGVLSVFIMLGAIELVLPYVVALEKVSLVYDPLLGFRGRSNLEMVHTREMKGQSRIVKTNSFGFHDYEPTLLKGVGTKRLVFVGDSFLEAYQVEIADNFCRQTEDLLKGTYFKDPHIEAFNQGLHGYGMGTYALYIQNHVMTWQPDAVVLTLFMGNDLHDNYAPLASSAVPRFRWKDEQLQYTPAPSYSWKMWARDHVLAHSTLIRFLWRRVFASNLKLMQVARSGGLVSTPQMVEETLPQLQELTAIGAALIGDINTFLKDHHVGLFVFVIPDPLLVNMTAFPDKFAKDTVSQRLVKNKTLLMRDMIACLKESGIPYVLPLDVFVQRMREGDEIYLNGYGHFSKTGHRVSTHVLAPALADWLGRSDLF